MVFCIVFISFVDLTRLIKIGNYTLSAIFTITLPFLVLGVYVANFHLSKLTFGYIWSEILFLFWTLLSFTWGGFDKSGLQNFLAFLLSISLLLLAYRITCLYKKTALMFLKLILYGVLFACLLFIINYLFTGSIEGGMISPRPIGYFGIVGVSLALAFWRGYKANRFLMISLLISLTILLSLSRMAFILSLLLIPFSGLINTNNKRMFGVILITFIVLISIYYITFYYEPLRNRFFSGDLSIQIINFNINASGRINIWRLVLDSYTRSPILGQGAGSSNTLTNSHYYYIDHPHNDYLRLLHDYGIVGTIIWITSKIKVLNCILSRKKSKFENKTEKTLKYASFLIIISLFCLMLTGNPLVYNFFMCPFGIIIGSYLGCLENNAKSVNGKKGVV